jgi:hypothetical protein
MLQLLLFAQVALALTAAAGSYSTQPLAGSDACSDACPARTERQTERQGEATQGEAAVVAADAAALSRDWTGKTEDNICGLRDLTQVSNPVVIDFQACLDATPEMKKIKSEKIDPKSPEGIRLVTEATNRVTQACEAVQRANGYCSVWKSIRHKDGRAVTDISSQVTAQF